MKIYVIRHGLPNYEIDSLTEEGFKQAYKLGEKYKDVHFDSIYVSTHGRTIKTSEPLVKHHPDAKVFYVDWAREDEGARYYATQYNGGFQWFFWIPEYMKLFKSLEVAKLGNEWYKHPEIAKTTMPEGFKIMSDYVDNFMKELGYEHDREHQCYKRIRDDVPDNVAVVAHGGFAFSFISNLLDIPYPEFTTTHACLDCTGVTILDIWDGIPSPLIIKYNDTSHLDIESDFKEVGV